MSKLIELGKYRHYKGQKYEVIGTALNSENLEPMVIYRALYDSKEFGDQAVWVRPVVMFKEMVTVGGKEVLRFSKIEG